MKLSRPVLAVAAAALTVSGLTVVTTASAEAADGPSWCAGGDPQPCVEHLYVDGVEKFEGDLTYGHYFSFIAGDASPGFQFSVNMNGSYQLPDTSHTFKVVINSGSVKPRVATGRIDGAVVSRGGDAPNYTVTATGKPVTRLRACLYDEDFNLSCPFTAAPGEQENVWFLDVDNGDWWGDNPDQVHGLDYFSNIDGGGIPPDYNPDTGVLRFLLANAHENHLHEQFFGKASFRLPNRFVKEIWGIPDPNTMTSSSLAAVLDGGTGATGNVDIYQETGDDAMRIDLSNVSFSKRRLKVTIGNIKPTRPKIEKAKRVAATRGTVTFTKAKPRGAKVSGYSVRCVSGKHVVTDSGRFPTVAVTGLKRGRAYDCKVRAKSKAGPGRYSTAKKLPK